MADLRYEIRSYIVDNYLFGNRDGLQDSDSFWELGLMDSTGVLELISYLEERYAVQLESGEIIPDNLDSIDKLTKFVMRKRGQCLGEAQDSTKLAHSPGVLP